MKANQMLLKLDRTRRKMIFSVVVIGIVTSVGCILYPPGQMPITQALIVSMELICVFIIWIAVDMPDQKG
ncbi:MAG: hypothetical protein NTW32_22615 [Chloroflexi bacterium]|nr:hypothetical protein [Chloroflexota bacterium]